MGHFNFDQNFVKEEIVNVEGGPNKIVLHHKVKVRRGRGLQPHNPLYFCPCYWYRSMEAEERKEGKISEKEEL